MNKIFKTINNFKNGQRVTAVASELAQGTGSTSASADGITSAAEQTAQGFKLRQLTAFLVTGLLGVQAWALPTGGQVVNGSATIATTGGAMTVQQAAGNATINWNKFNVGTGESVSFNLANPNNITLNRVGGDSVVNGSVTSNGNLWFATGGNLFTVGSNGSISAMKEVFITTQEMAVGQYIKPTGTASSGAVNVLPAGKLAARLIHIDAGSVNMSRAELIANSLDDDPGSITITGQRLTVTDSTLSAAKGNIIIGREGYGMGELAQSTDVSGSTLTAQNVETSAEVLTTSGVVVKASNWLLDPTNVTISASASTGGTLASALGQAATSNISTTDLQTAINAGTNVNVVASGSITQSAALAFNVTGTGQTPTLTLDNTSGSKQAITLAAITDTTAASGSAVNVKAISAGGTITAGGAISTKGSITLDNTYGGTAGAGGTPTSGFISVANNNVISNANQNSTGIQVGGNLTAGTTININSVNYAPAGRPAPTAGGSYAGVYLIGNITAAGDIFITSNQVNAANILARAITSVNTSSSALGTTSINSTNGNVKLTAYSQQAITNDTSGVLRAMELYGGSINGNTVTLDANISSASGITTIGYGVFGSTPITTNAASIIASGSNAISINATVPGGSSPISGITGISYSGNITNNANSGDISFLSNAFISQTGAVTVAANTSGAATAVTYDTTSGSKNSTITTGASTLASGSTSPINYSLKTSGAAITVGGAVSVPGTITLDNTYAGSSATNSSGSLSIANATTASGVSVTGNLVASNLPGATNAIYISGMSNATTNANSGVAISGTLTGNYTGTIYIKGVAQGAAYGVYDPSSAITSSGAVNIIGTSPTGVAVSVAATITAANGITITGNGTTATTITSVGSLANSAAMQSGIYVSNNAKTPTFLGYVSSATTGIPTPTSGTIAGGAIAGPAAATSIILQSSTANTATYLFSYHSPDNYRKMVQVEFSRVGNAIYAYEKAASFYSTTITTPTDAQILSWAATPTGYQNPPSQNNYSLQSIVLPTYASGDIAVIGNNTVAGGNTGITQAGVITQNANGGNISFTSNNTIIQAGAITVAANTSGTASAVTYDTTTGDKTSNITAGALTVTGGMAGSSSRVDYTMKSSGSNLRLNGAITVPGSIALDNTYLNGVANGITVANANTYSTSANYGVYIPGTLTAGAAVNVQGVNSGAVSWAGQAAIQTAGNISILSAQKFAGNGITFNGLTTAANGQPLNSVNTTTFQSGTSAIVGGDVNFFQYNTGANSAIYGGSMPITAYGANINIGTSANPIYGGAAINGGLGAIVATKVAGIGGNVSMYGRATASSNSAINQSGSITADGNITLVGNSVLANPGGTVVNLTGPITLTNVTNNSTLSVTGNTATTTGYTGANAGISVTGNIVDNSNGGNISFVSNSAISQTGTTTLAANTNGTVANVTYDTTTGNKSSNITTGALTLTGGVGASNTGINYSVLASGANITVSNAISMPGTITLNNSYLNGVDLGINSSNITTYATTGQGISMGGALTAANVSNVAKAINIVGVSNGNGAANLYNSIVATNGDINIQALSTGTGWYSIYTWNGMAITANAGNINISGSSTSTSASGLDRILINNTGGIQASGNVTIAGYDASTIASGERGVNIQGGVNILAGGNLTLGGTGASAGVYAQNGGLLVARTGNLTIEGASVDSNGWAIVDATKPSSNTVAINGTALYLNVGTTSTTVSTGPVTGTFMGAQAGGSVNLWGSALQGVGIGTVGNITGGTVTLKGKTTGYSATSNNPGVWVQSGNVVSTVGAINIYGSQYGNTTGVNDAVYLTPTSMISAKTDINIAGYSSSTNMRGVNMGGALLAGGNISIGGQGGAGGVWISSDPVYAGGNLNIQNAALDSNNYAILTSGAATATGSNAHGVMLTSGTTATTISTGPNTGTFTGLNIAGTATVNGTNNNTTTGGGYGIWYGNGGGNYKAGVWNITASNGAAVTNPAFYMNAGILTSTVGDITINASTTSTGDQSGIVNIAAPIISAGAVSVSTTGNNKQSYGIYIGNTNNAAKGVSLSTAGSVTASGAINGIYVGAKITNTGTTGTGVVVSAVGNATTTGIQNSGSNGISVTGGAGTAAGTVTNGSVISLGTLTNTGGVISISTSQPQSSNGVASTTTDYIAAAEGITSANASTASNVAYGQVGGVMAAPSKATVNNINYRTSISPLVINAATGNDTQVYGTAYNSTTQNTWLRSSSNTTISSITGGGFGATNPTNAQALASLGFASTIGGNSNAVQTSTSLVGMTGVTSSYGTVNITTGTYTITKANLSINTVDNGFIYNGFSNFNTVGNLNYSVTGLVSSIGGIATGDSVTSVTHSIKTGGTLGSGTLQSSSTVAQAGTFNDTLSAALGTGLSNYNITYVGAAFTVAPAPLSVVGSSTSKVYNGSAQTNGAATITGLKGTESITVTGYGTGTTVAGGPYADNFSVTWGTALASNYTLTKTNGALTITPAALTISASPLTTTYGTAQSLSASSGVTTTGLLGSDSVTSVGFTYNGTSTVPGTLSAGTYANALVTGNATGSGLSNYNITYGNANLVVTKANLTIAQPAQTLNYNGTLRSGTAASSLGTVSGNTVSTGINGDTFTVTGIASGTNVGSYTSSLLASGGNASNYNISYTNGTLTITPATLTITAASTTKVYDGTTATSGTPTVSGLFGLDSVTGLGQAYASKSVLGTGGSTLSVNSGYTVSDGNSGQNYTVVVNTATGTITPRPLTVTGISAADKVYDGTNVATITASGAQVSGAIVGDAVTTSIGAVTGTFANVNVGTGKAINLAGIGLSGADAGNYTLAGAAGLTAAITARPVVITGATTSNTYTASTQTNTYTVQASSTGTGVVAGQSITATGSGSGLNVGTHADNLVAVAGAGTALSNYSISYVPGSLTITPATLGAVATANSKVYDAGTATTGSIALTGLLGADAGTVRANGTFAFGQSNVGSNLPVTVSGATLTGAASGNYVLPSITNPTASITPAALTVKVNNDGKLYSLTDAVGASGNAAGYNGFVYSGFAAGQNATVLGNPTITVSRTGVSNATAMGSAGVEAAGNYTGVLTATGPATAGNYLLNYVPGNFTIAPPGTALIRASSANVYGTGASGMTPTVAYLDSAGSTVVNLTQSSGPASGLGTYTFTDTAGGAVSFSLSASGLASSTAGSVKVGSYGIGSLLSGLSVTASTGLTNTSVTSAGSYTVTPAPATITATAASTVYNSQTQTQSATTNGVLTNDKVAYAGLASGKNVAAYSSNLAVTASSNANSADADNYTFTLVNNNLTITPYQLSYGSGSAGSPGITATANNRIYDGTTAATGTLTPVLFAGDSLTASAGTGTFDTKHVGAGKTVTFGDITLSGSAETLANYSLPGSSTITATANITPAPLSITGLTANSKLYDGTTNATLNASGASVSGVMVGDSITVTAQDATGTFASKNVGAGMAVTVSNAANALTAGTGTSGEATQLSDYALTAIAGLTANIAPTPLTITGLVAASKVYDGNTATALTAPGTATISGVAAGDMITLNASGASGVFADKNVGNNIAVSATLAGGLVTTGTGSSNVPTLLSNYTLASASVSPANITPAPLTVTGVTAANKVYDGTTDVVLRAGSAALSGAVAGETLTLNTSGIAGVFTSKNAATAVPVTVSGATVTASGGALLSNYTLTQAQGVTANITPAPLTVTGLTASNKVYDATTTATLNTSGASVSGVVAGDLVTVSLSGATGTFADKNVGNNITVTVAGASSALTAGTGTSGTPTLLSNYSLIPLGSLTANITPAPLSVTGMTAADKVYNGSMAATLSGGTLTGVQGSDSVTLNTTGATGTFASKDAGNNIAVTVSGNTVSAGAGTMLSNYSFADPAGITASITPKPLTMQGVTAADKVYNGNTTAVINTTAATLSGLVPGEIITFDTTSAVGNFASKNASTTPQAVTVTGVNLVHGNNALLSNYTLDSVSGGTALITPAPLTVTGLVALNKVYDRTTVAQLDASAAQLSGVVAGDSVSFAPGSATGVFADRNVATGIAVSVPSASSALVAGSGTLLSNYTLNTVTGLSADITPKPLTATGVTAANKVYDGTTTVAINAGGTLVGVLAGDSIALDTSSATGTFAAKDVGNGIAVTVAGAALSAAAGSSTINYALTQPTGVSAHITPASLVITGQSTSPAYNGTTQTNAAANVSGLMAGEAVTVTGYGSGKDVGTYADNLVAAAGANTLLSNYTVSYTNGALAVTPYQLNFGNGVTGPQITAAASNKVYDTSTAATGALTVTGLFAGDVLTASATSTQFDTKDVGTSKTVTFGGISLRGTAQTLANYGLSNLPTVTASADITPAPLKVYVQNDAKFVTQTDALGASSGTGGYNSYQLSGFVGAETAPVLNNPVITVSRTGITNTAVLGAANVETAGTYTGGLTATGPATVGNYALTYVPGNFTIVPAGQLLIKTAGATSVYASGAVTPVITSVSYMDTTSGNAISSLTLDPSASSGNSFTYRDNATGSVTFTLAPQGMNNSASGNTQVGSHALDLARLTQSGTNLNSTNGVVTGNLQVTPKPATVTANTASSIYNGALQTQTSSASGLVNGDAVNITGLASGTNVGSYASTLGVSGADAGNYSFVLNDGALTITPYQLNFGSNSTGARVVATANDKVYNGSAAATGNVSVLGLLGSDVLTASSSSAAFDTKDVGTGKIVTFGGITIAGDATTLANYALGNTSSVTTTAHVTPAPLLINGASTSTVYNRTTQTNAAANVSGLVAGEAVTVTGYGSAKNVGTYADNLVATAGANTALSNYAVTYTNGALTITPYQLSLSGTPSANSPGLTAVANNRVYNGNTSATGTLTPVLFAGDTLTATASNANFDTKDAGNGKTVTFGGITLTGDPTTLANYALGNSATASATANITPATATVSAIAATQVFSGLTQNQTVIVTGYLDADDAISGLGLSGQVSQMNVGSYQSTLTTRNSNYKVTVVDAPFVILPGTPAKPNNPNVQPPPVQPKNGGGVTPAINDSGTPSAPSADPASGGGSGASPSSNGGGAAPAADPASGGGSGASPSSNGGGAATAANPASGGGSGASPSSNGGGSGASPTANDGAAAASDTSGNGNDAVSASTNSGSSTAASGTGNGSGNASGQGSDGLQENKNVRNYDLIGFSSGSDSLSNDSKDLMDSLSERKVVITGYADKEEADPMGVSLRRAQLTRDHLISKGWNPSNITIKAYGATDQFDKQVLVPNRRVYIQGDWPVN